MIGRTLGLLSSLDLLCYFKGFARMYDINDCTWSGSLEVLQEHPRVPSIGIWRVDALRREVIELLEVGIHDDLLLIGVFERFRSLNSIFTLRAYRRTST